ncbi:MAG: flavocytochrome c [Erysipelotrichaceae bacterium]|nr:flavocytochrome c [Erysipelotrichaceae bacterium]
MENALSNGGIKKEDLGAKETTSEAGEETKDVDVVVVGAGGAGMSAAITAAQEGKSVIIVEKADIVGGNSSRATGGMNAAKTVYQDENTFEEQSGVEKMIATAKESYPELADLTATVEKQYADYQANPEGYFDSTELFMLDTLVGGKNLNDPELVKTLVDNSADAIDWLAGLEAPIALNNVSSFGGASVKRIHRPVDAEGKVLSVGSYMVPLLEENCEKLGVEILKGTTADAIIMKDGVAAGVSATSGNTKYTINAKSVVLATGGFAGNLEMVVEYKADLDGFITTNAATITGDGIKMAEAVGAGLVDMDQIQIHPTVHQETSALITEGLRGDGAILVNQEGVRFCDEVGTRDAVSAAELAQTGGYAYLIVDQKMVDASSVIAGYIKKGLTIGGGDVKELAEAIGCDEATLTTTLETWNAAVAAQNDAEFGRTSFAEALDTAPYYAIKIAPGVHHTMGGVMINTNAEVLTAEGEVIPGLYAAGEVTGGVHGANRLGGNAVADIVVFGRIAGSSAAANAK